MLLLYVYNQLKHVYGCALDDVENVREKSSESRVKWDYLSTSKGRRKSNRQSWNPGRLGLKYKKPWWWQKGDILAITPTEHKGEDGSERSFLMHN